MTATPKTVRRFRNRPIDLLSDTDDAVDALTRHVRSAAGGFDTLSASSDPARIGPLDLIALQAVDAAVPAPSALWLLDDEGQWLTTEILSRIPGDADLWSCHPSVVLDLADLYHLLRRVESQHGATDELGSKAMGRTPATWLLAAKRPRLVPANDGTLRKVLGYSKDDHWWRRWRLELDRELVERARHLRRLAATTDNRVAALSELRVLDITLRGATT